MDNTLKPRFDLNLFPQKITVFKYPLNTHPLIDKLYQIQDTTPNSLKFYPPELIYQTPLNLFSKYPVFNDLKEFILNSTQHYYKKQYSIFSSWGNIYSKYSHSTPHDHSDSDIIGIFYLKTPRGCGTLKIHNKYDIREFHSISLRENSIIVMGGDQWHSTGINLNNDPKISIAFNLREIK